MKITVDKTLEYTAAATGILGACLITSLSPQWRTVAFAIWLVSNGAWIIWGLRGRHFGMVGMQSMFMVTSVIGFCKNLMS